MGEEQGKSWNDRFQEAYNRLDAFIIAEEKIKAGPDLAAWAGNANQSVIAPVQALLKERFGNEPPLKAENLDLKAKKKDDHLKRLKAIRYAIYTYQRKAYLEEVGDLG
jgi:hypothetical protein